MGVRALGIKYSIPDPRQLLYFFYKVDLKNMTLSELKLSFPDATDDTRHQHSNGGGWIQNTATVADTAYVGPDATVSGSARISDNHDTK